MEKIKSVHLNRLAVIYLRQSTQIQVLQNSASTALQYSLRDRAETLGWRKDQIKLLDGDLGKSGQFSHNREAFNELITLIIKCEVGIVLVTETTRISRDSVDWARFVQICEITNTLIADYENIYDPNNPVDSFSLGIKATLTKAEAFTNRLRFQETKLLKVRKGEYHFTPPTGYIWNADGKLIFDPETGVQDRIQYLFDLLEELGTAFRVLLYCQKHSILIPTRYWQDRRSITYVKWELPHRRRLYNIFHNPTYAGAYTYNRTKKEFFPTEQGRRNRIISLPIEQWGTLIFDHHPGYISWDRYLEIQELLARNSPSKNPKKHQANPKGGKALLTNIVICGKCGRPMNVQYHGYNYVRYYCDEYYRNNGEKLCWSTSGNVLDEAIGNHVLQFLNIEQLDLAMAVLSEIEQERQNHESQRCLSLKQAEDAVAQAKRRYERG